MTVNQKTQVALAASTKVVTKRSRGCFMHVSEAWSRDGQDPSYSMCALIDKSDVETLAMIDAAIEAAKQVGAKTKWGGKIPPGLRTPLRDGDTERDSDEYKDCFFLNARSKQKPRVVDLNRQDILDPSEIYSGAYYRVALNFYPYDVNGNRGIGCGLGNVQKVADGERLGGGSSVEQDFADTETADYLS